MIRLIKTTNEAKSLLQMLHAKLSSVREKYSARMVSSTILQSSRYQFTTVQCFVLLKSVLTRIVPSNSSVYHTLSMCSVKLHYQYFHSLSFEDKTIREKIPHTSENVCEWTFLCLFGIR